MNKDADKTKEQLIAELAELRKKSKEQEDKLKASNQQLDAHNQQLEASNEQLIGKEKALKESEDRLAKTMIAAKDGMWDWNLKTNEVYFDPRYYEMAGYRVDEFPYSLEEFQKRVHPDDVDYVMNEAQKHLEGKIDRFIVEFRFKKKNGDWLWIQGHGQIVERDEKSIPLRFIGTHRDITERKQAEEKIIAANKQLTSAKEKAEESDRLKSAFLTNMSHEIRTPMNGILGFTELLKESQLTGDEKEKYIQVIEKSGKRMLKTINDIIDISRIEAGQVKVANSEVSVNSLLDEQFNFFQREVKSKGLELNYKPSLRDSESRIITDPLKLEGILTNLLKNAVKYTETGEITFGCRLKDREDGTFIEFYVKDTGIGIPANRVEAIFNRFEQADIADTRVFEGSGLGLAISKSYVEMLGGEISVKSKEGKGATFTFSLPYNKQNLKESSATQNKEEESGVSLKNLSVIVAEDDETSRMLFETILENHVKGITYTTTGKETIEKFCENPDTDIILMDIKMPDINGYDATREIRKFNKDVIILAQTAYGMSDDKEKALEAGCDDYIAKPIKKEILFEKIRDCLDKKSI
ncbi:MAG: response regulator [Bacteroidota bacterium]|nr:response regulator [Bacteroidota bacterium]